jgi:hypothetical protein
MTSDEIESRLLSLFTGLQPRHQRQLEMLLDHPIGRRAFRKLIEGALDLQNGEMNDRAAKYHDVSHAVQSNDRYFESPDPIRQSFSSLLWDKETFPTTYDVIAVVRHFFGIKLEPLQFRKAGRKAVISRAWKYLSELSERERTQRLRKFFTEFAPKLDPDRSYRELFRILSRSE